MNPTIVIAGIELEVLRVSEFHVYLENSRFPSVAAGGANTQEAINEFLKLLPDLITEYALCPDEKLSGDGKELKYYLLKCFNVETYRWIAAP